MALQSSRTLGIMWPQQKSAYELKKTFHFNVPEMDSGRNTWHRPRCYNITVTVGQTSSIRRESSARIMIRTLLCHEKRTHQIIIETGDNVPTSETIQFRHHHSLYKP